MKFKNFIKNFKEKITSGSHSKSKTKTKLDQEIDGRFREASPQGRKENPATIEYGRDISAI